MKTTQSRPASAEGFQPIIYQSNIDGFVGRIFFRCPRAPGQQASQSLNPPPMTWKFRKQSRWAMFQLQTITLTPVLDTFGIILVGGRLPDVSLPEDVRHPIVLSSDSQQIIMVISDIHNLNIHSATEQILHTLRVQYHILHPRATINKVIRHCSPCKLRTSQPDPLLMAPPAIRLKSHLPPFTNIGLIFLVLFHSSFSGEPSTLWRHVYMLGLPRCPSRSRRFT